eukprot:TRINITY_DN1258_c0_g1_i1.p2 TRINITY_DN1258_c0_g1~~TRINITY_DN1258_c0_g1_i1.p2  ORF type:complete len:318 (+),score=87.59 TRINITY_DN1258_c0_g1_i1:856-1809(+)
MFAVNGEWLSTHEWSCIHTGMITAIVADTPVDEALLKIKDVMSITSDKSFAFDEDENRQIKSVLMSMFDDVEALASGLVDLKSAVNGSDVAGATTECRAIVAKMNMIKAHLAKAPFTSDDTACHNLMALAEKLGNQLRDLVGATKSGLCDAAARDQFNDLADSLYEMAKNMNPLLHDIMSRAPLDAALEALAKALRDLEDSLHMSNQLKAVGSAKDIGGHMKSIRSNAPGAGVDMLLVDNLNSAIVDAVGSSKDCMGKGFAEGELAIADQKIKDAKAALQKMREGLVQPDLTANLYSNVRNLAASLAGMLEIADVQT